MVDLVPTTQNFGGSMVNKIEARGVHQEGSSIHTKHLYATTNKGLILNYLNARLGKFVVDTTTKEFWK